MRIRVRVPATTSNLGPGFDVLGMALGLHNELELHWEPQGRDAVFVDIEGEGAPTLPRDGRNLVIRAFRTIAPKPGGTLRFRLVNRIPLARGLGSSAAARLCGLLAAAAVARGEENILELACRMEGHPDNVVPAIHGGLCASTADKGLIRHFRVPPPTGLVAAVCIPDFTVSTPAARALLPKRIPREDAIHTSSRTAFLLAALERRRFDWLSWAMDDVLHQPYRARLVPGMDAVIHAARHAGAYGAALSGSGPAMLALCAPAKAKTVGRAMQAVFAKHRIRSKAVALKIEVQGAQVSVG